MKKRYKFLEEEPVYNVRYDPNRGVIKYYSDKKEGLQYIYLTKQQIIIFNMLVNNGQNVTTREEVFSTLYKIKEMTRQDNITLNLSISRLRIKIKPVANLIAKKGIGFVLEFKGVER